MPSPPQVHTQACWIYLLYISQIFSLFFLCWGSLSPDPWYLSPRWLQKISKWPFCSHFLYPPAKPCFWRHLSDIILLLKTFDSCVFSCCVKVILFALWGHLWFCLYSPHMPCAFYFLLQNLCCFFFAVPSVLF